MALVVSAFALTIAVTGVSTQIGRAAAVTPLTSVKVCNQSSLGGSLPFEVNNAPFQVPSGGCHIEGVPVGDNLVKELVDPTGATELKSIGITPPSANVVHFVVNSSSQAGHAKVDVAAGTTVTVTFTNWQAPDRVKVCTALTTNSQALTGNTFHFTVTDVAGTQSVSVVANALGQTPACTLDSTALPAGSIANVTEAAQPNIALTNVNVAPVSADAGSTATTGAVTVQASQAASAIFTNEAMGWVQVCAETGYPLTGVQSPIFTVNGGSPFGMPAGQCSRGIEVPIGTATITYPPTYRAEPLPSCLGDIDITGVYPDPMTVDVCYGMWTVVTFTDAPPPGQFKICTAQTAPDVNLGNGEPFVYDYSYTVNGTTTKGSVTLTNPENGSTCSAISAPIPVVNANGSAVSVSISEEQPGTASVELSDLLYQGAGTVISSPSLPTTSFPATIEFSLGSGGNVVTFTQGSTG